MPNSKQLSDSDLGIIAEKLKHQIGNKEYPHQFRDYKKAAVLFHSINNLGYYFYSDTLEKVFELSSTKYSEKVMEDLKHIAESMAYLDEGLRDPLCEEYKLHGSELAL